MADDILIFGAGRIGSSVAHLAQQIFAKLFVRVYVADVSLEALQRNKLIDKVLLTDRFYLSPKRGQLLQGVMAEIIDRVKPKLIINALPHTLNDVITYMAAERDVSYLDMSEDVRSRRLIEARTAAFKESTVMPQQGLAPGLVNIIGCWLLNEHQDKEARELRLRVGALPQVARGRLGYATTWSVDGLVNEYLNDVEELVEGKVVKQPGMSGYERLLIRGVELEAFRTSGGAGDLPRLLKKRVPNVNYKTLRWPGHHDVVRLLLDEFRLDRELLKSLFKSAVPTRAADCVYLLASLDVKQGDSVQTYDFGRRYTGLNINGQRFDAIQAITALGAVGVIELFYDGKLPKGLVTHDMIDYAQLEKTESGKLLNMATDTYLNGVW